MVDIIKLKRERETHTQLLSTIPRTVCAASNRMISRWFVALYPSHTRALPEDRFP